MICDLMFINGLQRIFTLTKIIIYSRVVYILMLLICERSWSVLLGCIDVHHDSYKQRNKELIRMKHPNHTIVFIGAQILLCLCALGISVLAFTLAPLIVSILQIPLNVWLLVKARELKFWRFFASIQILNISLCIVLITMIQIFGRRYFLIFLDVNAWSF